MLSCVSSVASCHLFFARENLDWIKQSEKETKEKKTLKRRKARSESVLVTEWSAITEPEHNCALEDINKDNSHRKHNKEEVFWLWEASEEFLYFGISRRRHKMVPRYGLEGSTSSNNKFCFPAYFPFASVHDTIWMNKRASRAPLKAPPALTFASCGGNFCELRDFIAFDTHFAAIKSRLELFSALRDVTGKTFSLLP